MSHFRPVRGRSLRAHRPGAFEVEGRALGAPPRLENLNHQTAEDLEQQDSNSRNTGEMEPQGVEADSASVHQYIEAVAYAEHEAQIVYAVAATFGIKYMLRERPGRRLLAFICLTIVGITVGVPVVILNAFSEPELVVSTGAPAGMPTGRPTISIITEIEQAAEAISGAVNVFYPESPQQRAVGWLSTWDKFDTQGFGLTFTQRYVLTLFYYATNGEDWLQQESWLSPTLHVCDWSSGIVCETDPSQRRIVTGISLTRNGLSGPLPNELCLVQDLTLLEMPQNNINGTIPHSLTNLNALTLLDLSANQLSGTLPSGIGKLGNLLYLQLFNNALTGTIPASTYCLPLLKKLDISNNNLNGTLAQNIRGLTSLDTLNVQHNSLEGWIPSFESLKYLDFILLDYNEFSGPLPNLGSEIIGRLTFTFSHNRNSGRHPQAQDFTAEQLQGVVFRIQRADFSYNQLTGSITQLIAMVPSVQYFDLSGNSFTGRIPAQADVASWQSLQYFGGADNQFTGTIPPGFSTALTALDMSGNRLNGQIPDDLYTKFPNLESLNLSGNPLGGGINRVLGTLISLHELQLSNCNLIGSLPANIDALSSLGRIDVSDNKIEGTMPSSIGSLTLLTELKLQNNGLTGSLPADLGSLNQLSVLNVANNSLTGTLPLNLGHLSKLQEVDVSVNSFVGAFPEGVCGNLNFTSVIVGCDVSCSCCSHPTASKCQVENVFVHHT